MGCRTAEQRDPRLLLVLLFPLLLFGTCDQLTLNSRFSPPEPDDNDTTVWKMFVYGPSKIMYKEEIKESPYKGASFLIQMKLMDYPQKAPKVSFVTRIFHPL